MGLGPNDRRLSAYHIRRACEASLRRLQTDHIDLYQMHHVDRATPWEEIWQAMEQLVARRQDQLRRQQQLRRLGRGPRPVRRVGPALPGPGVRAEPLQPCGARRGDGGDPCATQPRHRSDSVQPAARRAARWRACKPSSTGAARTSCSHRSRRTATSSKRTKGCAARWARPRRTSRWPGSCRTRSYQRRSSEPTTTEELTRAWARSRCSWTTRHRERLDQIWPGPGEAPQAYAW